MEIPKIEIPADWNAEKDLEYHIENHGRSRDYYGRMLQRIRDHRNELRILIEHSIKYFLKGKAKHPACALKALSFERKFELFKSLIARQPRDKSYHERFGKSFVEITATEALRNSVLEKYFLAPELVWLKELIDLDDRIGSVCYRLDESMLCEHDDYVKYDEGFLPYDHDFPEND